MWPQYFHILSWDVLLQYILVIVFGQAHHCRFVRENVESRSRHVVSSENNPAAVRFSLCYTSSMLLHIRQTQPKNRLAPEVWRLIGDLGCLKRFRSKRGGVNNKAKSISVSSSSEVDLECNVSSAIDHLAVPTIQSFHSSPQRSVKFPWFPGILLANVRSLRYKIDELQAVVSLNLSRIVCITESWLNSDIVDATIYLSGFSCFRRDRPDGRGGVCVYVDCHTPCQRLSDFETPEVESLWLNIRPFRLPRAVTTLLLGVVYHPPSSGAEENANLLDLIRRNVDSFLCKHPEGLAVVCGDFNPPSTGLTEKQMKQYTSLTQVVKVLTRDTGVLDWCLTNRPKLFAPPQQLPKLGTSDHYTVLIQPKSTPPIGISTSVTALLKRDLRPSRIDAFGRWITQFDWSDLYTRSSVKEKFDLFSGTMVEAIDRYFPLQRTKCCSTDKPWLTSKFKTLISRRQKALSMHGKDSCIFKHWRNRAERECKTCKCRFYENKVAALKDCNMKRWWKEIKGLTGQRSVSDNWVYQMLNDECPTPDALADRFNSFLAGLTSHFTPLELVVAGPDFVVPGEFLVDERRTYKSLCHIKVNKSPGPSVIPNKILKEFAFELAPVLTDIYNSSLKEGYVPVQLKESLVRPLPKCSPPKSVENDLRPITLTSQIAKIMEGFTLESLYKQVIDRLDPKQFAVSGKSTTHALVYTLHCILEALDKGHCYARVLFTDFSKGFDLVDHNVLCDELRSLGVHEVLIRWIGSFLTNRSQKVKVGSYVSCEVTPRGGIPQGTKLAPLLFAILVNNLVRTWNIRAKYVDDLTVVEIIPRCSPSVLPYIAGDICLFASEHGMRLNPTKCKEMLIDFLIYKPHHPPPLQLAGYVIERCITYKLLGVQLSDNLSWNAHCDYIVQRARKRMYALRTLKKVGVANADLVLVYCCIIRSILEYASPVWAALPGGLAEYIEKVQKTALRIIYPDRAYDEALVYCGLATLTERRVTACQKFIRRVKDTGFLVNLLPHHTSVSHSYGLRSGDTRRDAPITSTQRLANFVTYKFLC